MFTESDQLYLPGKCYWSDDTKTLEFSRSSRINIPPKFAFTTPLTTVRQGRKEVERVNLEDVKRVALHYLPEDERHSLTSFYKGERAQHTDAFIWSLLHYLSCILKRHLLEKRHQSLLATPGIIENTHQRKLDEMNMRIEASLKHLGYKYCNLLEDSISTQKDKAKRNFRNGMASSRRNHRLYESLCSFCIRVGWVTFSHQDLDVIQAEVYRLLRSNAFNSAPKDKDAPPGPSMTSKTTATQENRNVSGKGPGIHSILSQRSPLITAVLPTPKEKSASLFQKHAVYPKGRSGTRDTSLLEMTADEISPRIGIIGKPIHNFNQDTLMRYGSYKGVEMEEQRDEDTPPSASVHTASIYSHHSSHRQQNAISRASTEAVYSTTGWHH